MTRFATLLLFALAGCGTSTIHYDSADQQGPLADFSGRWISHDGSVVLVIDQKGPKAKTVISYELKDGTWKTYDETGTVKGRVYVNDDRARSFTLASDGKTFLQDLRNRYDRWNAGLSKEFLETSNNQDLCGGIILHPPVHKSGALDFLDKDTYCSPVFAMLTYLHDERGQAYARALLVPLQSSRIAVTVSMPNTLPPFAGLNRELLMTARAQSPSMRTFESTLDGKPCWWVTCPVWELNKPGIALEPSALGVEYYTENPAKGAMPAEVLRVAVRGKSGDWEPMPSYLMRSAKLLRVELSLEDGRPSGFQMVEDTQPLLEAFLVAEESSLEVARWRTRGLVAVKNRTLPGMLKDWSTADLKALVEKLENHVLDVNFQAEKTKDEAQKAVEKGTEGEDHLRQMASAYKERIEVLKPIIIAVKDEVANRER